MPATPIELGPFNKGVNLVDPPSRLGSDELAQCLNLRIGVRGNIYKRPGHGIYGATQTKIDGDKMVSLLLRYYKADGTKKLIGAALSGKLKFGDDVTGLWTQIDINGVAGNNMGSVLADWMVYKNRLYITDGLNPQRYNGTDNIFAGHFIHSAPTLAPNTSGSMALGTYKYFVTSVAGDMGEGPKGVEATITLTGVQDQVDLSAITVAPAKHEEVTKKIYRTKVNGTLFYFLAEIATGTTIYSDVLPDSSLGDEFKPTHAPYADSRFVIMGHDQRAYWFGRSGVNASIVDVSDIGFPDRILDTDNFPVANNDGDILTGAGLVPGGILFCKRTSLWLSRGYGYGLVNIYPKEKKGAGVGSTAPFSIVTTPIGLIFLSQRGEVYLFDGTNITEIGRGIASEFKGMTETAMGRIVACYHDYRYIISYDYRGSKGYNWKTLEYDTKANKWEGPDYNGDFYTPSYYSVWDSVLDKGELAWGESKAAAGSYAYVRTEFTKTDRGNKFLSTGKSGSIPTGRLAEVKSIKAFIEGTISSDTELKFTHIDEIGRRTSVVMTTPISIPASKLNGTDDLGPTVGVVFKLGGTVSQVSEGSLDNCRSRIPAYEITDGATAVDININNIMLLADALPLK